MNESLFNTIFIITVLLIISGLLSYMGDILGYRLGKKRLSLFGLRPRQTAQLITIMIGVFITLVTLTFAASISENVRIFLFQMDEIRENIGHLEKDYQIKLEENELIKMKNDSLFEERTVLLRELENLTHEIDNQMQRISELEKLIEGKKSGIIAFTAGQIISYSTFIHSTEAKDIEKAFEKLIREIIDIATEKGAKPRAFNQIWKDSADQRKVMINSIQERFSNIPLEERNEIIVKVICTNNIFKGEGIESINLVLEENEVIYPPGTIFKTLVDGRVSREKISFNLQLFLAFLREKFSSAGIMASFEVDPLTFYDLVNAIYQRKEPLTLVMIMKEGVTKLGPFEYLTQFESNMAEMTGGK